MHKSTTSVATPPTREPSYACVCGTETEFESEIIDHMIMAMGTPRDAHYLVRGHHKLLEYGDE